MQNQAKNLVPRALRLVIHHSAFTLLFFLTGCQVLGLAAYKLHGPAKVPAKYLPQRKPMLVLVENYRHQSSVNAHADVLAQFVMKDLEQHKVAPLVPLEKLQALRDAKRDEFGGMSIAAIGRETGASQILYVQLHRSDVTPLAGGDTLDGKSEATVKVVDVATGETLWPAGVAAEAGYPVSAATKLGTGGRAGGTSIADVRQRLYYELGNQIARLFYKWQPEYDQAEGFQSS